MAKDEEKRLQLVMPAKSADRLEALKGKTEASTYSEVIRNALRFYDAMMEEHERGSEFLVRRPDGELITYKLFA